MVDVGILAPEKTAFIAYNIGVYESAQKFGNLITSGKITDTGKWDFFAYDTAKLYVDLYGWYQMSQTLHKMLIHAKK